ncbi:S1C family serine protease [Pedobacter sp. 22226]|uniref:S1C family serine protease n=1 Tax=Pedobacter sp. 22226 TaxID=3453894 RepID=UPI003F858720
MMRKTTLVFILPLIFVLSCSQSGKPGQAHRSSGEKERNNHSYDPGDDAEKIAIQELNEKCKDVVFSIYASDNSSYPIGSGFIVSDSGIAVSNYHPFSSKGEIGAKIKLKSGREYDVAKVLFFDKKLDYMVFRLEAGREELFPVLSIASEAPRIGQTIAAIDGKDEGDGVVSTGIVTSLKKEEHLIQTTAVITRRNSGGPLLNIEGKVVGITIPGIGKENLNFAIDIRVLDLK